MNRGGFAVPIFAAETHGSNCFYQSMSLNRGWNDSPSPPPETVTVDDSTHGVMIARLKDLASAASSLGAHSPSPGVVSMALRHPGGVHCVSVADEMAMQAALLFAGMVIL